MKDQYFGDVNDYRKYGLLRLAAKSGLRLGVCWMLTESRPDERDGRFLSYLNKEHAYRHFDPELFDWLKHVVRDEKDRHIAQIVNSDLLRSASFYPETSEILDNRRDREEYFSKCARQFARRDLVFFDPDNGLAVKSVPRGRENSCKYLYWDEMCVMFREGFSVMV